MAKYKDKLTGNVLDFSEDDIRFIRERKLTRRYVPFEETSQEVIEPRDILKPQLILTNKKGSKSNKS